MISTDTHSTVSVVILTCGASQTTLECLESIAHTDFASLQLVVVNNGGDNNITIALDHYFQRWGNRFDDLQLIQNDDNCGACTGRNQALARVDGEFVVFLDNDIICRDSKWLSHVIELLKDDLKIGIVGPRIIGDRQPYRLECAGHAIRPTGEIILLGAGADIDDPIWRKRRIVQCVGNFATRTTTIREIGGFDTSFDPFGFENIDCCYRVKLMGLQIMCHGLADLYHVGHVTTGGFGQERENILFEKSLLLRKRWFSVFKQEQALFEELMTLATAVDDESTIA